MSREGQCSENGRLMQYSLRFCVEKTKLTVWKVSNLYTISLMLCLLWFFMLCFIHHYTSISKFCWIGLCTSISKLCWIVLNLSIFSLMLCSWRYLFLQGQNLANRGAISWDILK